MIKYRVLALLVALVSFVGIGAVAASPAYAAWTCRSGANCFYDLQGGVGTPYESFPSTSNFACHTLPTAQRNKASSVYNRKSGTRIWYYARTSCQEGSVLTLNAGEMRSLFAPNVANNNIESYRVCYFAQTNCYQHDNAPVESITARAVARASCTGRHINLSAHPTFNPDTGNWRTSRYTSGSSCGAVSMADTQWYYQIPGRTPQLVLGCAEYRVRTYWTGTDVTKVLTGWETVCQTEEQVHETISGNREFRVEIRHPSESQRRSNVQPFFNLYY